MLRTLNKLSMLPQETSTLIMSISILMKYTAITLKRNRKTKEKNPEFDESKLNLQKIDITQIKGKSFVECVLILE